MLAVVYSLLAATGFGATAIFARLGLPHIRTTSGTLISLMVSTALTMSIALVLHPREIVGLGGAVFLWLALAGAIVLGPRTGKYGPDGKTKAILGHNIPLAALGVFILWFGVVAVDEV